MKKQQNTANTTDEISPNRTADPRISAITEPLQEYDLDDLEEIMSGRFNFIRETRASAHHNGEYDRSMYNGFGLIDDQLSQMDPKYNDLRTNLIRPAVSRLISMLRGQELEGSIEPIGGGYTDDEAAQVASEYDLRLRSIQKQGRFKQALNKAIKDMCVVGEGYISEDLVTDTSLGGYVFKFRRVDWRNIWLDPMSEESDLSDANHLFYIKKMELAEAIRNFPNKKQLLIRNAFDANARTAVAAENDGAAPAGIRGNYLDGSQNFTASHADTTAAGMKTVNIGLAYFRLRDDPSSSDPVLYQTQFVMPEGMNRMFFLQEPWRPYAHNRIPFSRLTFELDGDTNSAYSPLVRGRRGLEKAATSFLRSAVRYASARGLKFNIEGLRAFTALTGRPMEEYIDDMVAQNNKAIPAYINYGPDGALEIEDMSIDLTKAQSIMQQLVELNDKMGGIAPEILGGKAGQIAGITMEMKREEAMRIFPEAFDSLVDAVKGTNERVLACLHQFSGRMAYQGLKNARGERIQIQPDENTSIGKIRANWEIVPRSSSASIAREQGNLLMTAVQRMPPNVALALLPAIVRMQNPPNADQLEKSIIEVCSNNGIKVPSNLLDEEERQRIAMETQEMAAKQEMIDRVQIADMLSQIQERLAKTDKTQVEALQIIKEIMYGTPQSGNGEGESGGDDGTSPKELSQAVDAIYQALSPMKPGGLINDQPLPEPPQEPAQPQMPMEQEVPPEQMGMMPPSAMQ